MWNCSFKLRWDGVGTPSNGVVLNDRSEKPRGHFLILFPEKFTNMIFQRFKQEPNDQGWEFAHLVSEQIARFLSKNEQFAQKND